MNLPKHIETLLLDHDCVILPELGGFVVHSEQAYRDENGMYYPPRRSVGFNGQLDVNDGLLVQSIMHTYDTDYPEAVRMLEKTLNEVRRVLQQTNRWEVGSLGYLEQDTEGLLQFQPYSQGGVASPKLYGLEAFEVTSYADLMAEEKVSEDVSRTYSEEISEDPAAEKDEFAMTRTPSPWGLRLLKYAALFIGMAMVFFLTSVPVEKAGIPKSKQMSEAGGAVYKFPVASAFRNACESFRQSVPSVIPVEENIPMTSIRTGAVSEPIKSEGREVESEESDASSQSAPTFTIVLASMVRKGNAEWLVDKLKSRGMEEGRLLQSERMLRVVYSSYSSETEAYNALRQLRRQCSDFEDAWIMKVN